MRRLDVAYGSEEWLRARLGMPTASNFDRILTAKTLKFSAQSVGYMHNLLAEWALGIPLQNGGTDFMERGVALEDEAVRLYEMERDVDTQPGGFCLTDDGRTGCSPDRLVGDDGGLEIKSPAPHTHIRYLLGSPVDDYLLQVQGSLWITGRQWWDVMSYHPDLPAKYVRVLPDLDVHAALDVALEDFLSRFEAAKVQLLACGLTPQLEAMAA